ncbi:zinc ribbon domain-containing protein, partial [bacterium]|nr:zinc ribbon domain-containing protein [bacterium]
MGIFSNKCANPECNARVPKAAKFCNVCGETASAADTNCGRCGAVVGAQSKYCWKCGCDLKEQQKAPLFDNRWVRCEDDFAIRVNECDVKGFLSKGLIVEHGTRGMVFQRGKFCGYVDPGNYDMNGFLKKVNNFNQTSPTSVVLVDAGDVELHLEAIKLYSKEQMDVDAAFKASVRLTDPEKLYTNAFKGRNQLSVGYLAGSLTDELRSALQTYVGSKSVQELYSNTEIRQEVERQMQLELEPILERIGLEMVQIRFVDFF